MNLNEGEYFAFVKRLGGAEVKLALTSNDFINPLDISLDYGAINHIEMNYQTCNSCGKYADDGGLRDGIFTCHDCLEKKDGLLEKRN